jgi:hypothetical protein
MTDIQPITTRGKIIAWNVSIGGQNVRVELADLPAPSFPTAHQITHTAKSKIAGIPADRVALADAIESIHAMELANWEQSETIRKQCVKLANVDYRRVSKIENQYLDHSTVIGFDDACKSAAYEIPELGWNPDDDNGAAMWEIVSRRPAKRPRITDKSIVDSAIAAIQSRSTAETVPF